VVLRSEDGKQKRRELVATKEYFPNKFNQSIRQKSRWVLGISFLDWRDLGWFGTTATRWFLYRDRKAIWTAPTGMLAYAIVFQVLLYHIVVSLVPGLETLPALIERDSWIWGIIMINFWFLLNRVIHRIIFTTYNHGWVHGLISPIRIVVGNFIAFGAVWRAGRLYILHLITGKSLTWDKTDHVFPTPKEIEALCGDARFFSRLDNSSAAPAQI
jgi:adsorption protein B